MNLSQIGNYSLSKKLTNLLSRGGTVMPTKTFLTKPIQTGIWLSIIFMILCIIPSMGLADLQAVYPVTDSANDTYYPLTGDGGNYAYNDATIFFGRTQNHSMYSYFRWALNLPANATITYAVISVKAAESDTNVINTRIHMLDTTNCPDFITKPDTIPITSSTILWSPVSFTAGSWYGTSTIQSIIQSFINKPGYAYGNYIGIKLGGWARQSCPSCDFGI